MPRHRRKREEDIEENSTFEEDDDYDDGTGVYRSYGDYLESGEEVDPCKDALWLHDQED